MARVLSIFLPNWPTERLRRTLGTSAPPVDVPLVLKSASGRKRVVTAVDEMARRLGVYVGMPVAQAESLFCELVIMNADPVADDTALEHLAIWALRHYTPIVSANPPDGLILDIQGAEHLYGGEVGLVSDIVRRLADNQITAIAALADSWGAAHALARFGQENICIIEPGKSGPALLDLPVAALRLPPEMMPDLLRLGFNTIGQLAAKRRSDLSKAFEMRLFRRIDQAFGRLAEPIQPVQSPELISVQRAFFEPISAPGTLELHTRELTEMMCDRLEVASLGSRRLDLRYIRVDKRVETICVATSKPARDSQFLTKLLFEKIGTVDPGWGVDKMVMTASLTEPLIMTQVEASYSQSQRPDVEELWDTLANRGGGILYKAVSRPTDIVERAVTRVPPASTEVGSKRNFAYRRPQRIYRPEPIQALAVLPDHPPRAFTWRSQRYGVVCADGPERVIGEWWVSDKEAGKVRDYYILEVESGERFWAFRAGDGQHENTGSLTWYMQGKFD